MERTEIQTEVLARWELASGEVEAALSRDLVLAFLGSASAGKDSAIKALFGVDFGQIDPIPGSTEVVQVAAVDADKHLLLVNAPGFGDIRDSVDREARRVLDQLDIAVYVLNCDGGATIDERRDLDAIRALGRPTLVCLNKIDLVRPRDREEFVAATLAQLAVTPDDAVICAFDPLPALAEQPIGLEETINWIHRKLDEDGKSLMFAKHLRNRVAACDAIIRQAARRAAMAGALPVPGADITAVTALQVKLITDLAAVFGRRVDKDLVFFILGEALAGGSKGFIRWGVNAAKAAGWIPGAQIATVATSALGATVAGASTFAVGQVAVSFLKTEGGLTGDEIRSVFDQQAFAWKKTQT